MRASLRQPRVLTDLIDRARRLWPDRAFLRAPGAELTFEQVGTRSLRLATWLSESGIRSGDRVAVVAANSPLVVEAVFAASRVGAIWAVLSANLRESTVKALLRDIGPRLVVVGRDIDRSIADDRYVCDEDAFEHLARTGRVSYRTADLVASDVAGLFFTSGSSARQKA